MQGVTIAQANRGKHEGVPEIGNEVWIGTNAVIVGQNKSWGNNVLIAPNVYLKHRCSRQFCSSRKSCSNYIKT